jgi:exopolysaccharide biosynthesis protein
MVQKAGAIGGINGGAYINKDNIVRGGTPGGVIIKDGVLSFLQRENGRYSVIGFNSDKKLVLKTVKGRKAIENLKLDFAVSFGPALIINGEGLVIKNGAGLQPRSAIAQRQDGTVLLLAIDGRQVDSAGATLKNVQDVLLQYNAYNAANLDGGSSTTMVYNDKVINVPSERNREKYLPSAFLVMPYGGMYEKK